MSNQPSLREQIAENIEQTLANLSDPKPILVTREPFEVEKLAITQFPAILIQFGQEQRDTTTMSTNGRRQGTILFTIRGFVRGTELDSRRNQLIDAIETALDSDRYRNLKTTIDGNGVMNSQVTVIEVIPRLPPLAEVVITFQVRYHYVRGSA